MPFGAIVMTEKHFVVFYFALKCIFEFTMNKRYLISFYIDILVKLLQFTTFILYLTSSYWLKICKAYVNVNILRLKII